MRAWVDTLQRAVSVAFKLSLGGEVTGSGDAGESTKATAHSTAHSGAGASREPTPSLGRRVEVVVPKGQGKLGMHIGMVLDVGQTGRVAVLGLTADGRAQVGACVFFMRIIPFE
jgi:hypothetical protein